MLLQGRCRNAALLSFLLATSFLYPAPSCPALLGSTACSGSFRGPSLSTGTQLTSPQTKVWGGAFACGFHVFGVSSPRCSRCCGGRSGSQEAHSRPRGMCLALRGGAAVYRHPSSGMTGDSSQSAGKRPHHQVEQHRRSAEEHAGPGGARLPEGDAGKQRRVGAGGDAATHGASQVGKGSGHEGAFLTRGGAWCLNVHMRSPGVANDLIAASIYDNYSAGPSI